MTEAAPVLVVSPYGAEYGPPRTLEHAARAVRLAGRRPVCVVRPGAHLTDRLRALDPEVHHVEELGTVPRTLNPRRLARFARQHLRAARAIARIASSERAVAVYSISEATLAGGIAARRVGVPSLVHVIGMSIRSPRWTARIYIRLLDRFASRFVACSSAAAAMLTEVGVRDTKVDVAHNAIPIDAIDAAAGAPVPIAHDGPKIAMVAAYDPRKGHELFVRAAARIVERRPDARFYVVGGVLETQPESAAFAAHIADLVASLGLAECVERVGYVAAPEVYAWMRAMDVVVAPSRTEAFAHVVLEAMACERAVVATALEGNLDAFVHEESGLFADPEPESIAAAVLRLVDDPALAARLGAAASRRVRLFFDEDVTLRAIADTVASLEEPDR